MNKLPSVFLEAAVFGAIVGYFLNQEIRHGDWLQAIAATAVLAVLVFTLWSETRDAIRGRDARGRYVVGESAKPRRSATIGLVAACIIASIIAWASPHQLLLNEGTVGRTPVLVRHQWWRLITSPFLHANILHLEFNMVALFAVGAYLESLIGSAPLLWLYAISALGGELAVIAMGQDHTLGASGAIYGLLGVNAVLAWRAWQHGFRKTGKWLLTVSAWIIGFNLLLSASIPLISLATHIGGLITGVLAAMLLDTPMALKATWKLTEEAPKGIAYSCDARGQIFYHGPARNPLDWGWISPLDLATAETKDVTPQLVLVQHADPDELLITCPIPPRTAPA